MALCVFLFCTLQSALARLDSAIESRSPRRLITTNVMQMSALPGVYGGRIQGLPGVGHVARVVMFGGFLRGGRAGRAESPEGGWTSFFHNMAVDAEPYFAMNPELTVPEEQFGEFLRDLRGCVVGRRLARKLEWKIGEHIFLESLASGLRKPDGPFEFVVRGLIDTDSATYPGTETDMLVFHFKYLDTALGGAVRTSLYMVEIADPRQAAETGAAIDALFEDSSDASFTQTEKSFLADLTSMVGDLSVLLNGISLAVCFTILLVTANTMAMAVRERRTEIAVLKTIGFTSAGVVALVLAEALLVGLLGGALGLGATQGLLSALDRRPGLLLPGLAALELRAGVALLGMGVAALLGVVAGLIPAWSAYRAKVADMLRAV